MELLYRPATPADAGALAGVGRETFVETFGHLYKPQDLATFLRTHSEESWRAELLDADRTVLLVEDAGHAVAYAKVSSRTLPYEPAGHAMELRQFYVRRAYQGAGVAPRMMDWVLSEARRRGADEICLSVWSDNQRAKRFYARFGFEYVAPYKFMVGDQADEDEIWRLRLTAQS